MAARAATALPRPRRRPPPALAGGGGIAFDDATSVVAVAAAADFDRNARREDEGVLPSASWRAEDARGIIPPPASSNNSGERATIVNECSTG